MGSDRPEEKSYITGCLTCDEQPVGNFVATEAGEVTIAKGAVMVVKNVRLNGRFLTERACIGWSGSKQSLFFGGIGGTNSFSVSDLQMSTTPMEDVAAAAKRSPTHIHIGDHWGHGETKEQGHRHGTWEDGHRHGPSPRITVLG